MPVLHIKKITDIDTPSYSREGDAAIDLRASGRWIIALDAGGKLVEQDKRTINPGERILVKTGIHIAIPKGHYGSIRDRSGIAYNHGLSTMGGVIDETYRGEIGVILHNHSSKEYTIAKNERIAQMIIMPYTTCEIQEVDDLDATNRSDGAYGSSGKF